ncbi:hypothetical protein PRZ48_001580 [Zasmidium cellare]|uniref:Uncharacterized protein n=1 Tax=Zasmidium cellare TaxID=395010 RepID=A0ABR0F2C6_ZASCE|nr:hypothetical protein PRZ48_001580 [Zasmidium cellare]
MADPLAYRHRTQTCLPEERRPFFREQVESLKQARLYQWQVQSAWAKLARDEPPLAEEEFQAQRRTANLLLKELRQVNADIAAEEKHLQLMEAGCATFNQTFWARSKVFEVPAHLLPKERSIAWWPVSYWQLRIDAMHAREAEREARTLRGRVKAGFKAVGEAICGGEQSGAREVDPREARLPVKLTPSTVTTSADCQTTAPATLSCPDERFSRSQAEAVFPAPPQDSPPTPSTSSSQGNDSDSNDDPPASLMITTIAPRVNEETGSVHATSASVTISYMQKYAKLKKLQTRHRTPEEEIRDAREDTNDDIPVDDIRDRGKGAMDDIPEEPEDEEINDMADQNPIEDQNSIEDFLNDLPQTRTPLQIKQQNEQRNKLRRLNMEAMKLALQEAEEIREEENDPNDYYRTILDNLEEAQRNAEANKYSHTDEYEDDDENKENEDPGEWEDSVDSIDVPEDMTQGMVLPRPPLRPRHLSAEYVYDGDVDSDDEGDDEDRVYDDSDIGNLLYDEPKADAASDAGSWETESESGDRAERASESPSNSTHVNARLNVFGDPIEEDPECDSEHDCDAESDEEYPHAPLNTPQIAPQDLPDYDSEEDLYG